MKSLTQVLGWVSYFTSIPSSLSFDLEGLIMRRLSFLTICIALLLIAVITIFDLNDGDDCTLISMLALDAITGSEIEDRTFKLYQAIGDQLYTWETRQHSICVQGKGTIYWQVKADGYQGADLVEVQLDHQSATIYLDIELMPLKNAPTLAKLALNSQEAIFIDVVSWSY